VTVLPFLGGATALLAGWATSAPAVVFGGIVGIVVGLGALVTRAGLLGGAIARQLHEELRAKAHHATEAALEAFRQRLAQDKDARDEEMLDGLRDLARVFQRNTEWASRINAVSATEIASGVEELVRTCIRKLEDAFKLLETSRDLSVSPVRDAVLAQREEILAEVAASIRELTDLLAGVYTLGTGRDVGADTARVRERLKQSLDVARQVEEAMDPHAAVRRRIQARAKANRPQ
jgi:hypothetical protein